MTTIPAMTKPLKVQGRIVRVLSTAAKTRLGFQSTTADTLDVDFEGIVGNRHRGWTRKADARAGHLPRGTAIRNDRHVSIVSLEDLAEIARRLDLPMIDPAWLGANIVLSDIAHVSYLPRGTHLMCGGGVVLIVTDQNAPCTRSGEAIATHVADRPEIQLQFPALAHGLRGVVAAVECPGLIMPATTITARLPAQWIYG